MNYRQIEKKVFESLFEKHLLDPSFTFSVRKIKNKNAPKDYFIGTEKSDYFAFTLWDIPVRYKGASVDLIDYIIKFKDNKVIFYLQYFISKNVNGMQNIIDKSLYNVFLGKFKDPETRHIPNKKKSRIIKVFPSNKGLDENSLLPALDQFIMSTSKKVDSAIKKHKKLNANWEAKRIAKKDFIRSLYKLEKRLDIKLGENLEEYYLNKENEEQDDLDNSQKGPTEKEILSKARIGQGKFRKDLISLWKGCCITGIDNDEILRASHIKQWCASNDQEKLDEYNGLLLLPQYDLLFDKYLISFTEKGRIIISKMLNSRERKLLGVNKSITINLKEKNKKYLKYHRQRFYIKDNAKNKIK